MSEIWCQSNIFIEQSELNGFNTSLIIFISKNIPWHLFQAGSTLEHRSIVTEIPAVREIWTQVNFNRNPCLRKIWAQVNFNTNLDAFREIWAQVNFNFIFSLMSLLPELDVVIARIGYIFVFIYILKNSVSVTAVSRLVSIFSIHYSMTLPHTQISRFPLNSCVTHNLVCCINVREMLINMSLQSNTAILNGSTTSL